MDPKDFNTYGARRGNDEIMARGTFANPRIMNKLVGKASANTLHVPSGEVCRCLHRRGCPIAYQ